MISREVQLARHPQGHLTADCFVVAEQELGELQEGQVLVRNLWTSVDASTLLRLREVGPEGYLPPIPPGQPLIGLAVGEVYESRCEPFAAGDLVTHIYGFRDYALVRPAGETLGGVGALRRVRRELGAPEDFLGLLGHTGVTAYVGLVAVARLAPGDVVWVSAAAGATGSAAAQIAKLRGHTVIGSAGSDGAWLREGRLKMRTTVYAGLERAPEAIVGLVHGANIGKTLVRTSAM